MLTKFLKDPHIQKMAYFVTCLYPPFNKSSENRVNSLTQKNEDKSWCITSFYF